MRSTPEPTINVTFRLPLSANDRITRIIALLGMGESRSGIVKRALGLGLDILERTTTVVPRRRLSKITHAIEAKELAGQLKGG